MKIKALLVDDEPKNRKILAAMLANYCPNLEIVGSAASVAEALQQMEKMPVDAIFLDIEMPEASGFDLLRRLGDTAEVAIVFVTAHQHYALKALKWGAIDYLLKPVDIDELRGAVQKIEQKAAQLLQRNQAQHHPPTVLQAINFDKIKVSAKGQTEFVPLAKLMHLKADGSGTWLFLNDGQRLFSSKNLGDFEKNLPDPSSATAVHRFFRVHHGSIVNLTFVKKFDHQQSVLTLENGMQIEVSQRRRAAFQTAI